jgi:hypothetical protein
VAGRPLPLAARLAALAGDSLWAVGLLLAVTLPLLLALLGVLGLVPEDTFALPMLLSVPVAIAVADALHHELLAVVDQTMQPSQASLWLRSAPHGPVHLR